MVGLDATPSLLAEAARQWADEGLDVEWQEGDMEALAVADASFDRVLSSFGAMFASDQRAMAAQLVRACRAGGLVGLTAWSVDGLFDRMGTVLMERLPPPPPGSPSPRDWASRELLERIFAGLPVRLEVDERTVPARFPLPQAALELFETSAAPIMAARHALEGADRWEDTRAALVELFDDAARPDGEGCRFELAYVIVVGEVGR